MDQYEILDLLGAGAYAEVYKARDSSTGRLVVLKSPDPTMFADPALFQRYRREMDIARTLDHPNVQRSYDLAVKPSDHYLVLEYVEGQSLRRIIATHEGPIPLDRVVRWGRDLAAGLEYLHDHGIVHRDLKPENVLITTDGTAKVSDFGTAMVVGARRLTWRHLTESLGTADYMSPEQAQGGRGDARSDIYAWGVVMYELLAGHVPFGGDNWLAVMAGHLQRTPEPIRRHRRDCPPALEAIVLHAMRRLPENRYQSAAEILTDLDASDRLDPSIYDLSPERPLGGLAVPTSAKQIWLQAGLVAVGFIAVVALIITLSIVFRS